MPDTEHNKDLSDDALTPRDDKGSVVIENPPSPRLHLTADATEISALRMLDAADKARNRR
ncbi:MAG TPA: hypothetical protein VLJ13_02890 [Brevundimonas sp.]|nr:hypothetical protein [Brevundimonas sp.]